MAGKKRYIRSSGEQSAAIIGYKSHRASAGIWVVQMVCPSNGVTLFILRERATGNARAHVGDALQCRWEKIMQSRTDRDFTRRKHGGRGSEIDFPIATSPSSKASRKIVSEAASDVSFMTRTIAKRRPESHQFRVNWTTFIVRGWDRPSLLAPFLLTVQRVPLHIRAYRSFRLRTREREGFSLSFLPFLSIADKLEPQFS